MLKHALSGILAVDDVLDEELRELVKLYLRFRRPTAQIERLQELRRKREEREAAAMLARWE